MKDWCFYASIIAFTLGFLYAIFLMVREERRAAHRQRPFLFSQAPPPVQLPPPRLAVTPETIREEDQMPEFLDLSEEDFKIYFDAYERRMTEHLGLPPGTKPPPLNTIHRHRGKR